MGFFAGLLVVLVILKLLGVSLSKLFIAYLVFAAITLSLCGIGAIHC